MSRARPSSHRFTVRLGALAALLALGGLGAGTPPAVAAPTPLVDLKTAATYAVLSGASVGNTASALGAPHTTLRGDLGVKAAAQPTGFPPGVVTGTIEVGSTAAAEAHADLVAAYTEVAARTGGATLAGALAGATIAPGLHTVTGAASNTGTVTLDAGGNADAVFVFQIGGAMALAAGSHVVLAGGAQASRVFWQVNGAGAVGANATFAGTLMAMDAVTIGNGTMVSGRAFARNGALTLDANEFYSSPPAVAIAGGATAYTADSTPAIGGTTDVEAPGLVTVTIAGQTLTATPSGGAWSVTSAILPNGDYPVVASVTDAAGNTARASQALTVDTVLPVVTLDDGPPATNDPTPTIAGTSDAAAGTIIRVSVDAQALRALVHTGGTWNIRPAELTDGTRTVTASVTDLAGNEGTDSQALTVDTAAPAAAIAGGAARLTNDASPDISGTAAVPAGTIATVTLADETLTAPVDGGAWSVTASALADGPHRVVLSVSDTAGNTTGFTQTRMVDTVSPIVTIGGGAAKTTADLAPTIVGTSNAAPGTTVTVTIAGQTMTTLVQGDGTWNATPTAIGAGSWAVVASAPDPAGNVGVAGQTLTIAAVSAPPPPGPAPAPPGPAPALPSPTAPRVAASPASVASRTYVAGNGTQRVRGRFLSIGTKVTASASGRVVATASGSVRVRGVARAIRLTSARAAIAAGRRATLKLEPRGTRTAARAAFERIRRAVRGGRRVTATITVRIVDAAGSTRTVKRTVKLTR